MRMTKVKRKLLSDVFNNHAALEHYGKWEFIESTSFSEKTIDSIVTLTELGLDPHAFFDNDHENHEGVTNAFQNICFEISYWISERLGLI